MEDKNFSIGDTVKFTTNSGKVVEGKVIGIKSYAYVIEHKNGDNTVETIFPKSIVEAEQRSELHSVRGGNKEKIFTYYIMPSKRRQNNKKNSKKNNKSRNQRGGDINEVKAVVEELKSNVEELEKKVIEAMPVEESMPSEETLVETKESDKEELNKSKGKMTIREFDDSNGEMNIEALEKFKGNKVNDNNDDDVDDESEDMDGGRRRTHKKNRNNKKNKKNRKSQRRQRRR